MLSATHQEAENTQTYCRLLSQTIYRGSTECCESCWLAYLEEIARGSDVVYVFISGNVSSKLFFKGKNQHLE